MRRAPPGQPRRREPGPLAKNGRGTRSRRSTRGGRGQTSANLMIGGHVTHGPGINRSNHKTLICSINGESRSTLKFYSRLTALLRASSDAQTGRNYRVPQCSRSHGRKRLRAWFRGHSMVASRRRLLYALPVPRRSQQRWRSIERLSGRMQRGRSTRASQPNFTGTILIRLSISSTRLGGVRRFRRSTGSPTSGRPCLSLTTGGSRIQRLTSRSLSLSICQAPQPGRPLRRRSLRQPSGRGTHRLTRSLTHQ